MACNHRADLGLLETKGVSLASLSTEVVLAKDDPELTSRIKTHQELGQILQRQVSHFLIYQSPACFTDPLTILTRRGYSRSRRFTWARPCRCSCVTRTSATARASRSSPIH